MQPFASAVQLSCTRMYSNPDAVHWRHGDGGPGLQGLLADQAQREALVESDERNLHAQEAKQ